MKVITPELQNLIDKLKIAGEVYQKASSRVHNEPMTNQMQTLAERKNRFLEELAARLDLDLDEHTVSLGDRLTAALEKVGIEADHVLLRMNEKEVLSFCIKREQELIDIYQRVMASEDNDLDKGMKRLVGLQLDESEKLLSELSETRHAYDFQNR